MPISRYCSQCTEGGAACRHRGDDGKCAYEYVASDYEVRFRWLGEGPPPPSWWASGTKVYRSMSDYYDD